MGILDLHRLHSKQITDLRSYFYNKARESNLYKVICKAENNATPLRLLDTAFNSVCPSINDQKQQWRRKELHGTHIAQSGNPRFDNETSNIWLKKGNLFGETTGFMLAIQDRVIPNRNYRK